MRAGELESRRAGKQGSRRAGEQESRGAGEQESRRAGGGRGGTRTHVHILQLRRQIREVGKHRVPIPLKDLQQEVVDVDRGLWSQHALGSGRIETIFLSRSDECLVFTGGRWIEASESGSWLARVLSASRTVSMTSARHSPIGVRRRSPARKDVWKRRSPLISALIPPSISSCVINNTRSPLSPKDSINKTQGFAAYRHALAVFAGGAKVIPVHVVTPLAAEVRLAFFRVAGVVAEPAAVLHALAGRLALRRKLSRHELA